jgi:hypothetical protein
MKNLWINLCLLAACLAGAKAHASPILLVDNGVLVGASGVEVTVNGATSLYDVAFKGGTCAALFNGCDSSADFMFKTDAEALAASQALLDGVFLDGAAGSFDSVPETVADCSDSAACMIVTPYDFGFNTPGLADAGFALNLSGSFEDLSVLATVSPSDDLRPEGFVFAVWSPVPPHAVPAAPPLALAGAGLMAYAATRCRARRS